ncbi:Eukaryotic peptide chain release factor GTP-binding subunit ERF3A-like protein [Leptotrombidium deliense]|uniref:Eukaryotic peptide chain release factor GTP-binding subunit ERF3A-like protein n=1 Tax=Leptotrombidium deliense TaxID=299467 RepID=A0A443SEI3_9ACAR|nr:Eukaryotic peptide chain release factor GTP-binding subunit ERF3A-like protein [Leptotrombidium deliense]
MSEKENVIRNEQEDDVLSSALAKKLNVDAPVFVPSFGLSSNLNHTAEESKESIAVCDDWETRDLEEDEDLDDGEFDDDCEEEVGEQEVAGVDGNEPSAIKAKAKAKRKGKKMSESSDGGVKKEHVNIVFIGHVDAGKSTIGGQLLYLTGMVDKRTLEKYEREAKEKNRESWYLSWALDTNQEERDKGKTVEVGRAFFETEHKHFTLLDAPGHRGYVANMIGGAQQADLAVLVISGRKGEFETGFERGGQTREHAMLAKTAGVKHMIVLINKMDDPTVEWKEDRYNECKEKLLPYLKKCNFNPKTEVFFMPCSGITGAFLKDVPDESVCSWYRGPSFLDYIDQLPSFSRHIEGPFRMPVIDKYKDMGSVVRGKVESGNCRKGSQLMLMPNRKAVEVLQLLSDENEVNQVNSGENVTIKLKGVEEEEVSSGFVLCDISAPCNVGRLFDAQVVILEHKSIICPGYSAVLHIHAAVEEVIVKAILCLIDKKTGEKIKNKVRFVKQDQIAIMRLECVGGLICMETFSQFPQMGRFVLRDEGKTIAVGKVLRVVE